jgi:hypothetical protein
MAERSSADEIAFLLGVGKTSANSMGLGGYVAWSWTFSPNKVKCPSLRDNHLPFTAGTYFAFSSFRVQGRRGRQDKEQGSVFKDLLHHTLGATPHRPCMFGYSKRIQSISLGGQFNSTTLCRIHIPLHTRSNKIIAPSDAYTAMQA